jgi:lipopolysaccharide export system protein LptA
LRLGSQPNPEQAKSRSSVIVRQVDTVRNLDYGNGESGNKMLGNVVIEQVENGVIITCDSVYLYTADSLDLFSHIEVFQGASTIRCDKMTYDGGWVGVRGNIVRMNRDNMTLLTQYFDYNVEQELGIYFNGGAVDRNGELLESDRGYYYAQPDLFMFAGNVAMMNQEYTITCDTMEYSMNVEDILFLGPTQIWQNDSYLSANYGWQKKTNNEVFFTDNVYLCTPDNELWTDSLYYYQAEERGLLHGNIQVLDTVRSSIVFGDEGRFFNNPEFVEVYKNPAIAYYSKREENNGQQNIELGVEEEGLQFADSIDVVEPPVMMIAENKPIIDTLFLTADTIRSVTYPNPALYIPQPDSIVSEQPVDSVFRQMYAFRNVRAYRHDLQAVCDSMVFNTRDSVAKMYVNPVIWSDTTQISSDSIYFTMHNGVLDAADFYNSPFIAIQEDSARYTQVKGRNMKAFFANNAVDKLDVYGNAQNIYYQRDKGIISNVSVSESANMTIYFRESRIHRVKYEYEIASKLYPLDMLPEEDKELRGLNWQGARRPKSREDLFTRIVHPSERLQVESYEPPIFPITSRLLEVGKDSWIHQKSETVMPSLRQLSPPNQQMKK